MDGDLWARFAEVTRLEHVPVMLSRMRWQKDQKTQKLQRESILVQNRITKPIRCPSRDRVFRTKAAFVLAKAMRVGWKAAMGCYW